MTEEEFNAKLAEIPDYNLILMAQEDLITLCKVCGLPPEIPAFGSLCNELIRRFMNILENVK